jgi:hypothetical protein
MIKVSGFQFKGNSAGSVGPHITPTPVIIVPLRSIASSVPPGDNCAGESR